MANLTFSATTTAGTVTYNGQTVSDAQMDRFSNFCWYAYPQLNEDGTPKADNNANRAAAIREYFAALWEGTKANVISYEKNEAAQAAREAVGDIA